MTNDLMPSTQAVLDVFPEKKKDNFDRVLDVADVLLGGTVGSICKCANGLFETYALMQGRHDARKIVKYTANLEMAKYHHEEEMMKLMNAQIEQRNRHDIQSKVLTLYVDKQYQNTVDSLQKNYLSASRSIDEQRYRAIIEIDQYSKQYLRGMDAQYRDTLREYELVCAAYRDCLKTMEREGLDRIKVVSKIVELTFINNDRLNDQRFQMIIDAITEMTKPAYISFKDFVPTRDYLYKNCRLR